MPRPSHTPASASSTPISGRWDGGWSRRAPPTRTRWTTAPGSSRPGTKEEGLPTIRSAGLLSYAFSVLSLRVPAPPEPQSCEAESQKQQRGRLRDRSRHPPIRETKTIGRTRGCQIVEGQTETDRDISVHRHRKATLRNGSREGVRRKIAAQGS